MSRGEADLVDQDGCAYAGRREEEGELEQKKVKCLVGAQSRPYMHSTPGSHLKMKDS
jgi:hypothetical protein